MKAVGLLLMTLQLPLLLLYGSFISFLNSEIAVCVAMLVEVSPQVFIFLNLAVPESIVAGFSFIVV